MSTLPWEPRSPAARRLAAGGTGPTHPGHLSIFQLRRALSPRPGPPPSNSGSASQQLRKKEGVKYQHEREREQTGALEGGDKLWQRTKTFCQKLPRLLQECSFQAQTLACRQAHTHSSSPLLEGALLKGSCEGETFAVTLSTPACCGRSVVHRRLGSRGWSLGH